MGQGKGLNFTKKDFLSSNYNKRSKSYEPLREAEKILMAGPLRPYPPPRA